MKVKFKFIFHASTPSSAAHSHHPKVREHHSFERRCGTVFCFIVLKADFSCSWSFFCSCSCCCFHGGERRWNCFAIIGCFIIRQRLGTCPPSLPCTLTLKCNTHCLQLCNAHRCTLHYALLHSTNYASITSAQFKAQVNLKIKM